MARVPLFPRGKDFATWAQQLSQRYERDFAFLRPKVGMTTLVPSGTAHTISAAAMTPLSAIVLTPASFNAMQVLQGGWYIDTKSVGSFVLRTSITATVSCSIDYVVLPPPED